MIESPRVIPVECPFGASSAVYVYYVDSAVPTLIDTGVAASPVGAIEPALRAAGIAIEDVRLILATHGHWDHIGGAHAAVEATGRKAQVAAHRADAGWLRNRAAHIPAYVGARFRFIDDPQALAQTEAMVFENISGEVGGIRELSDGDSVDLGRGVSLTVRHTPGHSPGSVTYVLEHAGWAFTGDAVQACGSANSRFPLFADPREYRRSVNRLLSEVRPTRLLLGHRFLNATGEALDPQLEGEAVNAALRTSLAMEARLAVAAATLTGKPSSAAALAPAAAALGFASDDPRTWPAPFFLTLSGYAID